MTIEKLALCCLTPSQSSRTCGPYWFTVTANGMNHTAFATEAALRLWLAERGLSIPTALPMKGDHAYIPLLGAYVDNMVSAEAFDAISGAHWTRTLSNGDYTEAKITTNADGLRVVNYMGPNEPRHVFDYAESRALLG